VKFEVNCFSLLYSTTEIPFGNLKFFHLFSEEEDLESIDSYLHIAYGRTAEYLAWEWVKDAINQKNIKTKIILIKND